MSSYSTLLTIGASVVTVETACWVMIGTRSPTWRLASWLLSTITSGDDLYMGHGRQRVQDHLDVVALANM